MKAKRVKPARSGPDHLLGIAQRTPQHEIGRLFGKHPESLRLYLHVQDYLRSLGPVEIIPRKTQVGFARGRMFAWVWLPQLWLKKAPKDGIVLTFGLDHRVTDRRIKESVEPYPGRFTHHVVIVHSSVFDKRVRDWLREAYELAGKPGHRGVRAARSLTR